MAFPPAKGNSNNKPATAPERGPISTGNGGIPASLKIKKAGTKDTPGVEKTVNLF